MLPHIGFSLEKSYDRPMTEVLALLSQAGFSAVSPSWTSLEALEELAADAASHGMILQSLHATTKNIPQLWLPEPGDVLQCVFNSIDACACFHIPILVIHGWQGVRYSFPKAPLYFGSFDQLVSYAGDKGVSVAFENLEGEEYLAALMTRYRNQPHTGFCWDSGHDHCYPHQTAFLQAYGDRLVMTHLHDNFGVRDPSGVPTTLDDLHYLPGDGTLDWTNLLCQLQQARKQEILNFELKIRTRADVDCLYDAMPLEHFILTAGQRARQLAAQYHAML